MDGPFFLGVATGIATSMLIIVFRRLLGQLLSLITGVFSRSVRGTWSTRFWKGNNSFEEFADVYQLCHWVWGTITYPNKGRKYRFRGTLRSNVLVAMYEMERAGSTVDRGAFTLLLNPLGKVKKMEGRYSWTDDDTQQPEGDRYEWTKQE